MTKLQTLHRRLTGLGFKCERRGNDRVDVNFAGTIIAARCERGGVSIWESGTPEQITQHLAGRVIYRFTFAGAIERAAAPEERAAIIARERVSLAASHADALGDVWRAAKRLAEKEAEVANIDAKIAALEGLT